MEVRDQPQQVSYDFSFARGGASLKAQAQPASSDFHPARSFAISSDPLYSQLGIVSDDGSHDLGEAGGDGIQFESWVASSDHPQAQPSSPPSSSFHASSHHAASTSTFFSRPTSLTPLNRGPSLSCFLFPTQSLGLVDDPFLPSSSPSTSQDQPHEGGDSDAFGDSPEGDGSLGGDGEGSSRMYKKVSMEERRRASNRQSAKTFRDKKKNFFDQQRAELEAKDSQVAYLRREVVDLTRDIDSFRNQAEMERNWTDGAW